MSTSLDIPSSSGIVLVDNTQPNNNENNLIATVQVQQQQHDQQQSHHVVHHRQHHHQHVHGLHPQQQQQQHHIQYDTTESGGGTVEYQTILENPSTSSGQPLQQHQQLAVGSVINFTPSDVISNSQILKFVTSSDDGGGGGGNPTTSQTTQQQKIVENLNAVSNDNNISSYCGTTTTIGRFINSQTPKVNVISNVPYNPKTHQQQQQAITHTIQHDGQAINLVNNGKNLNFVNAYITTKTTLPSGKIVNIPFKTTTNANQMQHQIGVGGGSKSTATATTIGGNQLIQKVSGPRSVQFVTRAANSMGPGSGKTGGGNLIMSRSGGIGQTVSKLNNQHQQILIQQSNIKTVSNNVIKHKGSATGLQSVKLLQSGVTGIGGGHKHATITNPLTSSGGIKTIITHQPQKLSHIKGGSISESQGATIPSKYFKQFSPTNNNNNNNNSAVSPSLYSPNTVGGIGHPMIIQQQKPSGQQTTTTTTTNLVQYTQNNNNNNHHGNTNKNVSNIHPIQYQKPNVLIQGKVIKGSKYVVQQSQQQSAQQNSQQTHIVLPSATTVSGASLQHIKISQSFATAGMMGNGGGTIKYVNAQGNVIQPPQRVRAILHKSLSMSNDLSSPGNDTPSTSSHHHQHHHSQQQQQQHHHHQQQQPSVEDIMTEEMSARILQSLSQQKVFNTHNVTPVVNNPRVSHKSYKIYGGHSTTTTAAAAAATSKNDQNLNHLMTSPTIYGTSPRDGGSDHSYKVSSCDSATTNTNTTTTFIHNIPLNLPPTIRGDLVAHQQSRGNIAVATAADDDDELIGQEILPGPLMPVDLHDHKTKTVVHDHPYSTKTITVTQPSVVLSTSSSSSSSALQTLEKNPTLLGAKNTSTSTSSSTFGAAENLVALSSSSIQSAGLNYGFIKTNTEDDANSAISTGSRNANNQLDNDLGEETETAPEAEGEDDSVTRCICDLTHDDGYMICCDKCSAWQHVDCMGIDRQNIPEEYKCEVCQPRPVDKQRARSLQLMKRKEQQSLMLLNAQQQQQQQQQLHAGGQNHLAVDGSSSGGAGGALHTGGTQNQPTLERGGQGPKNTPAKKYKKDKAQRKSELSAFAAAKREKKLARANGKPRKEPKKISKRKSKLNNDQQADKSLNLKAWIENYEQAITNHYSPELRARLHAMGKHNHNLTKELIPQCLKNLPDLESNCATIPHAGGKILISMQQLTPNVPIIEIRGKYMLSAQFRQQQAISPTGGGVRNHQYNKKPGPFIFFYRLPNDDEICIDTRTYGNDARFVRRSCRPNSEVLHAIEKGTIHLYIVSLTNIANGTEITIKHEPHDLAMIARGTTIVPTSTICACGCPKDCVFSLPPPTPPPTPVPFPTTTPGTNQKSKKINGHLLDESGHPVRRTKNMSGRGRSTSSSGDSNMGMLSPNAQMATMTLAVASASPIIQTTTINPMIGHQVSAATAAAILSPLINSPAVALQMPMLPSPVPVSAPVILASEPPHVHKSPIINERLKEIPSPVRPQTLDIIPTSEIYTVSNVGVLQTTGETMHIMSPPQNPPPPSPVPVITPAELHMSPIHGMASPPVMVVNNVKLSPSPHKNNAAHKKSPLKGRAITFSEEIVSPASSLPSPKLPLSPPPSLTLSVAPTNQQQQQTQMVVSASPSIDQPDGLIMFSTTQPTVNAPVQQTLAPLTPSPGSGDEMTSATVTTTSTTGEVPTLTQPQSSRTSREPKEKDKDKDNSPKLTREERKMQAIMKAFEKMEKNQERKQQQKQNKTSSSTTKRRNSSPTSPGGCGGGSSKRKDDDHLEKSYHPRKKKRKGSKSYQHVNSSQKKVRRRSRMNSGDSDLLTSEESTPLLSPPLPHTHNNGNLIHHHQQQHHIFPDVAKTSDTSVNSAAGLLLALSHSQQQQHSSDNSSQQTTAVPLATPPHVSSTCLLVEAAVAPLEQNTPVITTPDIEVKYKGKTKKSIMNDWLNQEADIVEQKLLLEQQQKADLKNHQHQHQNNEQAFDNLMHEAVTLCQFNNVKPSLSSYSATSGHQQQEEPENLTMVAKKVEEFIYQNDHPEEDVKWPVTMLHATNTAANLMNFSNYQEGGSGTSGNTSQFITPTNCGGAAMSSGGSAAKKRWLRQAISEECNDDMPSPPNGFTTPLKKRRVIRECSETSTSVEDLSPQSTPPIVTYSHTLSSEISHFVPQTMTPENCCVVDSPPLKTEVKKEEENEDIELPKSETNAIIEQDEIKIELKPKDEALASSDDVINSNLDVKMEEVDEVKPNSVLVEYPVIDAKDTDTQIGTGDQDDEIDIVNSPPPGENIIAEDNLVKIEPEDEEKDDKIDVEENSLVQDDYREETENINLSSCPPPSIDEPIKMEIIPEPEQQQEEEQVKKESIGVSSETVVQTEEKIMWKVDEVGQESAIIGNQTEIKVEVLEKEESNSQVIEEKSEMMPSTVDVKTVRSEHEEIKNEIDSVDSIDDIKPSVDTIADNPIPSNENAMDVYPLKMEDDASSENIDSNEDEIADIQKRLHSFHTENLFILKSRNKKTKPLILKSSPPSRSMSPQQLPATASSAPLKTNKKSSVQLNFDLNVEADSETVSVKLKEERFDETTTPLTTPTVKDEKKEERHTRWDKPDESRFNLGVTIIPETTVYPSYMTTNPGYSTVVGTQPTPPPTIHIPPNTPASHLQYYNAFYNNFTSAAIIPGSAQSTAIATSNNAIPDDSLKTKYPSFSLLGDYLDAGGGAKSSSFNRIVAPGDTSFPASSYVGQTSTLLDTQQPTSYYSVGATAGATTSLISNFLNKSYSTCPSSVAVAAANSDPLNIAVNAGVINVGAPLMVSGSLPNVLQPPTLVPTPQKILTRTQSADPRLNPNLNTPEPPPAPKRKLSINEYRKRKQLSSETSNVDKSSSSDLPKTTSSSTSSCSTTNKSDSPVDSSKDSSRADEKELEIVVFSPAPTELEKQQEILSQRLKNYKSLQALTNSIQKPSSNDISSTLSSFVSGDKDAVATPSSLSFDSLARANRLSTGSNSSSTSTSSSLSSLNLDAQSPSQPLQPITPSTASVIALQPPSPPSPTSSSTTFPTTPLSSKR